MGIFRGGIEHDESVNASPESVTKSRFELFWGLIERLLTRNNPKMLIISIIVQELGGLYSRCMEFETE